MWNRNIMPKLSVNPAFTYMVLACGWGGFESGARDAGATCVGSIDICNHSQDCHKLNFLETPFYKWDLYTVQLKTILNVIGRVKMVVITAPCQGISLLGKFDPYDPLNALLIRCIRLAAACDPDIILIENVSSIRVGAMREFYHIAKFELATLEQFEFTDAILNSLHYRTAQSRRRWWCMGVNKRIDALPSFPPPDMEFAKHLHIGEIDPSITFVETGYHSDNGTRLQTIRTLHDFMFTITSGENVWKQDGQLLTTEQVLKYCGYPPDWKVTGSPTQIWNRAGNSVMPPMSYHLVKWVREQILHI